MHASSPHSGRLSTRAQKWLATLERRPAVPVADVESIILDSGLPCFDVWLDFHERYAGYLEFRGTDWALWGLIHQSPYWMSTMEPEAEFGEDTWRITCADAHPSYQYGLDNRGEFSGARAESFDIHVERLALGWDIRQLGVTRRLDKGEMQGEEFPQVFENEIRSFLVDEASDKYCRYYLGPRHLLVEDSETGAFLRGRALREA